jgi:hypothetical protein
MPSNAKEERQAIVVHFVRITTRLGQEEVQRMMEERALRFRAILGDGARELHFERVTG